MYPFGLETMLLADPLGRCSEDKSREHGHDIGSFMRPSERHQMLLYLFLHFEESLICFQGTNICSLA